jgi:hypothetical protein
MADRAAVTDGGLLPRSPALNARASGVPPSERLAQGFPVPPLLAVITLPKHSAGGLSAAQAVPSGT